MVFVALQPLKCVASAKTQPHSSTCINRLLECDQSLKLGLLWILDLQSLTASDLKASLCWDRCLHGKSQTGHSHAQGFSRTGLDITKGALNAPGQLWTIYRHREHMLAHGLAGLVCTYIPRTIWLCPYGWSMDYPYYMRPIIVWSDCFRVVCLLTILMIP